MNKYGNSMKANTSPKSAPYESSYDRQTNGHQAQNTPNSPAMQASANDGYSYYLQSDYLQSESSQSSANHSAASNDASYAYEQNTLQANDFNESASTFSSASDVSCGYKKATPAVNSASISDEEEMLLHYMQNDTEQTNKQGNDSTIEPKRYEQSTQDAVQGVIKEEVKKPFTHNEAKINVALDNPDLANKKLNSAQNNKTTNIKVSERVFMTSLLKHTGIALAIIVPLAAFSAYAATPTQTVNATNQTKAKTAEISIEPEAIIYKSATEPTTVDSVDLDKYAGTWYELGRLPMYFQRNCASDVTATYTEKTDGSGIIVTNKCLDKEGSQIVAEGLAKPADSTGSKLKVTFLPSWIRWLPVGRADYWVLARDADYKTALVGTPDKEYLWLLARSPNVTQQTYAKYRQIAQAQGYDLKEFTLTPHADQTVTLIP